MKYNLYENDISQINVYVQNTPNPWGSSKYLELFNECKFFNIFSQVKNELLGLIKVIITVFEY